MALTTRRQFVQQTAFAAAFSGIPIRAIARTRRMFEAREQNVAPVDASAVRKLASQIAGHVITPEAADYDPSRLVGNRAYDLHPALIVRCAAALDVGRALDFGQSQKLPLAVRGGGHSAAGFGVCDGGLVIDLSGMNRVEVDADRRVARAEAGSLVRDVDQATQHFDLATTLGTCPTVGIAGLTLGGGLGFLMSKYGAACDNVLSAHMVTVDGRQLEASQNSNLDLFWAIRGGGGNFGVATALEYQLHPVSEILVGALMYSSGRIPELLQAYVKFTGAAPDEMAATAMILPSEQGPRIRMLVGYCGQHLMQTRCLPMCEDCSPKPTRSGTSMMQKLLRVCSLTMQTLWTRRPVASVEGTISKNISGMFYHINSVAPGRARPSSPIPCLVQTLPCSKSSASC